jgi:2-phospho-L-lactate guanylyltransferase
MIVAAVPVKDLSEAKQRVGLLLTASERRLLMRAMLEDVLSCLGASPVDSVLVVTGDPEVTEIARTFKAQIVSEPVNEGHTAAVALAQRHLIAGGAEGLLTIPGDVPLTTPDEIATIINGAAPAPSVTFVPSRNGLGTNGALLLPPDLLALKFGEPSFPNHLDAARAHGFEPRVLDLPGLGLDIDTADDLQILLSRGGQTKTAILLSQISLAARVHDLSTLAAER